MSLLTLQAFFEPMQNRFADAHFISTISEAEAFREKALEFFGLNIHEIAYIPK